MNEKAEACRQFAQRYSILPSEAIESEASAIYWIHRVYTGISSAKYEQDINSDEAVVLKLMLFKLFGHVEGSLVAFVTSARSSACVISRTVLELAMSIIYILEEDPKTRLIQYFFSPLNKERKRLETLANSDANKYVDPSYFNGQSRMLDVLENWCKAWAKRIGDIDISKNWPDMFRVFEKSGYELQYRTAYATMSSKTHGQALDFLQIMAFADIAFTSRDGEPISAIVDGLVITERMIVYSGILYALEAANKYSTYFCLNDNIKEPIVTGKEVISAILFEMTTQHKKATEVLRD